MIYYLSLGTNLGDKEQNLRRAIEALGNRVGKVSAVSSFIATEPWGFESENEFLNAAVLVESSLQPEHLLVLTQTIERELGRTEKSAGCYHDRIIDIDLLLCYDAPMPATDFGTWQHSLHISTPELILPHPHINERDFVLIPLKEIVQP